MRCKMGRLGLGWTHGFQNYSRLVAGQFTQQLDKSPMEFPCPPLESPIGYGHGSADHPDPLQRIFVGVLKMIICSKNEKKEK